MLNNNGHKLSPNNQSNKKEKKQNPIKSFEKVPKAPLECISGQSCSTG